MSKGSATDNQRLGEHGLRQQQTKCLKQTTNSSTFGRVLWLSSQGPWIFQMRATIVVLSNRQSQSLFLPQGILHCHDLQHNSGPCAQWLCQGLYNLRRMGHCPRDFVNTKSFACSHGHKCIGRAILMYEI